MGGHWLGHARAKNRAEADRERGRPIRGKYSGHVIFTDQSEAMIKILLTNQRPVLPGSDQ